MSVSVSCLHDFPEQRPEGHQCVYNCAVQLHSTVAYTKLYWTNIQVYRSVTDPNIVCAPQMCEASVKLFSKLDPAKCMHSEQ